MKKKPHEDFINRKKAKKIREEVLGQNLYEFSATCDVSYGMLWSFESGRSPNLSVFTLAKIADGLGVSITDLINPEKLWARPSY